MCAGTYVASKVDAPQLCAVNLVSVYIHVARICASLRVVLRVARVPFHYYLILTVAVDIAHRAVVRAVCVSHAVGSGSACRPVEMHLLIYFRPYGCLIRRLNGLSAVHSLNDILGICRSRSVNKVGAACYQRAVNLNAVAIDVIAHRTFV